ncbi:hypothetical protein ABID21_004847 [Pseudorhizobium tarimense]|uniref:Uncharacterized protein n=1 Tax=Pseudorhizobium tarimense TaxID=1079109 RepID=A0ABV2HDW5_9HYPH|nr:hypothetical protein [Pseudorhizobium tarimense]MCJ8521706.1 hypothetical protein [Pseudorhizobium tarimense]
MITIPSLAEGALYDTFEAAREALRPHLSLSKLAARYGLAKAADAAA